MYIPAVVKGVLDKHKPVTEEEFRLLLEKNALFAQLIEQYQQEHDVPALEIAAALAQMSLGDRPLLMKPDKKPGYVAAERGRDSKPRQRRERGDSLPDEDKERFRIEVGYDHGVKPGNIVGAIANEAGLDGQYIGQIEINTDFTLVDLPSGMPSEIFQDLRKVRVCGQALNISRLNGDVADKKSWSKPAAERKSSGKPVTSTRSPGGKAGGKKSGSKKAGRQTIGAKKGAPKRPPAQPARSKKKHRKGKRPSA